MSSRQRKRLMAEQLKLATEEVDADLDAASSSDEYSHVPRAIASFSQSGTEATHFAALGMSSSSADEASDCESKEENADSPEHGEAQDGPSRPMRTSCSLKATVILLSSSFLSPVLCCNMRSVLDLHAQLNAAFAHIARTRHGYFSCQESTQSSTASRRPRRKKKETQLAWDPAALVSSPAEALTPDKGNVTVDARSDDVSQVIGLLEARHVMRIEAQHLDATNELTKTFGRRTIQKLAAADRAERGARGHGAARARGSLAGGSRCWFGRPRDTWPPVGPGLEMEALPNSAARRGEMHFAFVYSRAYREAQREVEAAVLLGDPNALAAVLRSVPFQVDALARYADYCMYGGQHELAAECVDKALHACEQAMHPLCRSRMLDGTARLPWAEPTNRPIFKLLQRHACALSRRGCHRTAFEVCRLCYSLDPEEDPMFTLQQMDFFALRAKQNTWLLSFANANPNLSLSMYPNWAFSLALAQHQRVSERRAATDDAHAGVAAAEADSQLARALLLFPAALPMLVRRVAADNAAALRVLQQWEEALASRGAQDLGTGAGSVSSTNEAGYGATLGKLLRLFVERHSTTFSASEAQAWLLRVASSVSQRLLEGEVEAVCLHDACALARFCEYSGAPARHDEFLDANPADFSESLPAQLPEDLQAFAAADGEGGARPARLPGRLVVPREERMQLRADTSPVLQFFLSLIPWAMPPIR
eukprot:4754497-Pleurochrysis_carterae.AAC.3